MEIHHCSGPISGFGEAAGDYLMAAPLLLGVPLIPVLVNAVVGVGATVAATRLISASTPTASAVNDTTPTASAVNDTTPTAVGSLRFWDDGIDAKEAAMIGAVGLSAFAMAMIVSRGKS